MFASSSMFSRNSFWKGTAGWATFSLFITSCSVLSGETSSSCPLNDILKRAGVDAFSICAITRGDGMIRGQERFRSARRRGRGANRIAAARQDPDDTSCASSEQRWCIHGEHMGLTGGDSDAEDPSIVMGSEEGGAKHTQRDEQISERSIVVWKAITRTWASTSASNGSVVTVRCWTWNEVRRAHRG